MNDLIQATAQALVQAKNVVISTGAGVSKESGVPTFRDAQDGLWVQYDPQDLATPQAFQRNPKLVWDWYAYRRELVEQSKPNPGHYAIAELETLLPSVVLVTQNVDNHHQTAGSQDIISLHGNLFSFKCSADCRGNPTSIDLQALPAWHPDDAPPPCPHCHDGLVRPDVVWFGESLPTDKFQRAMQEAANSDVMLVVGTSNAVYPAAWLPLKAAENGATVIEINPTPSELNRMMTHYLQGPSGVILPRIVKALRTELGR